MGEEHEAWQFWKDYQLQIKEDIGVNYEFWDEKPKNNTIIFNAGGDNSEMLRIAEDGFYVRGVKVEADADEAQKVYLAFKQWLTWNALRSN
jgi:hypothetical protein